MSFSTKAVKSTSLPQALLNDLVLNQCPLKNPQDVRFPNNEATRITHFVPNVVLTFPALRLDNRAIRLYFFATLLVMPTRIDTILGIPFLTLLEHRFTSL